MPRFESLRTTHVEGSQERMEMIHNEEQKIGGVLKKFQGKTAHIIGTAMLGLSLTWGVVHGAEGTSLQRTAEAGKASETVIKNYDAARRAIESQGIKLQPDAQMSGGIKDIEYHGALLDADNKIFQQISQSNARLTVQMDRFKAMNKAVDVDFEKTTRALEEQLRQGERLQDAAKGFLRKGDSADRHGPMYNEAKETLRAAKNAIEAAQHPSERQKKIYALQKDIDNLEAKEKKEKFGLELRDVKLLGELREALKQLKQENEGSTGTRQDRTPQSVSGQQSETPAEAIKRAGQDLKESTKRLEKLGEEYRKAIEQFSQPKK